jgi:hypothetical protein
MTRYDDGARITPDDGVLHELIDDEVVLLHLSSDAFYGLDEVANRMWELLKEHGTLPPVVAAIVDEYDVSEANARADLERLVDELASVGLLRVH